MKSLKNYVKNYIKPYINESVWDIEDNIDSDNNELILNDIKKFIGDNYEHINIDRCKIVFDEKKNKHVVNYDQQVILNSNSDTLTNGMFKWGTVRGFFDCTGSILETLEGAPEYIEYNFNCSGSGKLKSLEGAPKYVGGEFRCTDCPKLESLKGAPKKVGKNFSCSRCEKLKSLKGAPKEVGGDFWCTNCPNLYS